MIFDRTQNDVDAAIRIRDEKVKTFQALSESDIRTLERGLLTINTLNRIEDMEAELRDRLISMGYAYFWIDTKTWDTEDIFSEDDFQRIVNNLDALKRVIKVMADTPETPEPLYRFQNINDIEKILFDINMLIENANATVDFSWAIGEAHTGIYFSV